MLHVFSFVIVAFCLMCDTALSQHPAQRPATPKPPKIVVPRPPKVVMPKLPNNVVKTVPAKQTTKVTSSNPLYTAPGNGGYVVPPRTQTTPEQQQQQLLYQAALQQQQYLAVLTQRQRNYLIYLQWRLTQLGWQGF